MNTTAAEVVWRSTAGEMPPEKEKHSKTGTSLKRKKI